MRTSFLILAISLLTAACTTPANPPSLLPRAIEREADAASAPPTIVAPAPADATLRARLNDILAEARAGDADFAKIESANAAALRAGQSASQGSDAWINAEMARSALEIARQKSAAALADVDSLAVARAELASRDPSTGGLADILAIQAEIAAIVDGQTRRLNALIR